MKRSKEKLESIVEVFGFVLERDLVESLLVYFMFFISY